jgi:hypothetical protein
MQLMYKFNFFFLSFFLFFFLTIYWIYFLYVDPTYLIVNF